MGVRMLASSGALAVAFAVVIPAPASVAGQVVVGANAKRPAPPKAWTPPRTPDGQPDLQGIWVNNSVTPLERPKALEGRRFLTDEEVIELKKRAARIFDVNGNSDFAAGDDVFLAALANPERFSNPNATGSPVAMTERVFENRTSLIVDPTDGRMPPLTPEAVQKRAAAAQAGQRPPAGPEDLSNPNRCITFGVPRLGGNAASYNPYYQILQTPGYVVFVGEVIHDARIIPLDQRPHLPQRLRPWHGDSRGRWDGNTLIVDTTNFSPQSNFMGSAENLHVIERFTPVAPDTINYEVTLSDPTMWTNRWTAVIHLKRTQNRMFEYACHEGNQHTMSGILGAARTEEQAAEQAGKKMMSARVVGTQAAAQNRPAGVTCSPVSERAGRELGCYIVARQDVGRLGPSPAFWHLDRYPSRAAAEGAKGPTGVVIESLGGIWLLTIGASGWRAPGGTHVATIGPLPVLANREHTAQYMEAVFKPGMKSTVHRHSGPEAWYTLTGETCLETPDGMMRGRATGQHVVVPGGPPMELTATGTEMRRSLVLILHDSAQPATSPAPDWTPKGLCK